MKDAFTSQQLAKMRDEYGKISTVDPSGPEYKQLIAMLDKMHIDNLKSLAGAKIKFVSGLAQNRVNRASAKKQPQGADFAAQRRKERLASNGRMDEEVDSIDEQHSVLYKMKKSEPKIAVAHYKSKDDADKFLASVKEKGGNGVVRVGKIGLDLTPRDKKESITEKSAYEIYHKDYSSAVQTAIKQAEKRGFEVDMDDWHDKVATGPKKPSAGKTNSFSVKLKKDGKESKKALHLQVYNMDNHKYELNMYIESLEEATQRVDSLVTDALKIMRGSQLTDAVQALKTVLGDREYNDRRGHYNFYVKQLVDMYGKRDVKEAASPAQQAAIAIAMKKDGKKPKDMEESDAYDKDVKPSGKPHDKDAAAKRAVLAALAARKKMKAEEKHPEDVATPANKQEPEGTKKWLATKKFKKEIKEAEGGGTSISGIGDASNSVKRAQVLLKSTQLRLKHEKEREAMAKQKQALQREEEDKEYPEVKTGGKPLAKKFEKAFAKMGIKTNIKMKTVGNTSINEKEDKKEENGKEAPAKQKAIKKGETLSGKQEPIKIDPEIESR